jgi:hypothetical protein
MGGINIHCGSFSGEDKSGSAFEGVLAAMAALASGHEAKIIAQIQAAFDGAADHLLIPDYDARDLLPLVRKCRAELEAEIGPAVDAFEQIARDETETTLSPTDLKYSAGLGWRYYCVSNLLRAFEIADQESQPVALVW